MGSDLRGVAVVFVSASRRRHSPSLDVWLPNGGRAISAVAMLLLPVLHALNVWFVGGSGPGYYFGTSEIIKIYQSIYLNSTME